MTTWSLTPLFNELDVLEIRLAELDPLVDIHVIAESTVTFSGKEKPLCYLENKERFAPWKDKIRYVIVDDSPMDMRVTQPWKIMVESDAGHWDREHHQRRSLLRGINGMKPDDLVLISDMDEIPRPEAFNVTFSYPVMAPLITLSEFWINWRWRELIPVVARFTSGEYLMANDIQTIVRGPYHTYGATEGKGLGWHFSYLGGVEGVRTKLAAAAHHELMRDEYMDENWIKHCMETGADLFGRLDRQSYYVPLEELPQYVQQNPGKFAHLMGPNIPCL